MGRKYAYREGNQPIGLAAAAGLVALALLAGCAVGGSGGGGGGLAVESSGGFEIGDCRQRLLEPVDFEIEVETSDDGESKPMIYACLRQVGGKAGMTVLNNRSIGLEFPVTDGMRVVETGASTIAERAWGPLNSIQYGSPWLLVPGNGFVTLAFDSLPDELRFRATNSAFVFDLLLSVAGGGGAGFVACAHTFSESVRASQLSLKRELSAVLLDGIKACGGGVGAIVAIPDVIDKAWDSIGSLDESATVSFDPAEPGRLPQPQPAPRLAGPVDFTGIAPVRVGMSTAQADAVTRLHFLLSEFNEGCGELRPSPGMGDASEDDYLPGASMMLVGPPGADLRSQGRIARVDVYRRGYETVAGVGIGSTEAEVKRAYEPFVRVTPHAYTDGHYLIASSPQPSLSGYRIVFETDGERVTSYRAGRLPEVEYIEGCL